MTDRKALQEQLEHALGDIPGALHEGLRLRFDELLDRVETDHAFPPRGSWLAELPQVCAASEFVASSLAHHPALLTELVTSGDLERACEPDAIARAVRAAVADVAANDEDGLRRQLRRVRRRETVRLAWRDLAGHAGLEEVMAAMSSLAEASIGAALDFYHAGLEAAHGTPTGQHDGEPVRLVVLGLGKLGGRELNFSSDVDLVFAYRADGETAGEHARRTLTNHEFFLRLARRMMRGLAEPTADGYVFRVDLRLRPNGDSGPLALSFDAMESYYETHGRDWERYALIKARVVAGARADGERLLADLRPFVYRKYLDFGAFEAIRDMKTLIQSELAKKGIDSNIKLGPGGIREIEFIAQSFQLIRGGRDPDLQCVELARALERLRYHRVLDPVTVDELRAAYRFLRTVEHRLQMFQDRQTHLLPEAATDRCRLAWSMGFADWKDFREALQGHQANVRRRFDALLVPSRGADDGSARAGLELWQSVGDPEAADALLAKLGFDDPEPARQRLDTFRQGSAYGASSSIGRTRLDRLVPLAVTAAGASADPGATLGRVLSVIEAITRRPAYLALLIENPLALEQLVKLSSASPWISAWISMHPVLLDELLSPLSADNLPDREALGEELAGRLDAQPEDDLEAHMETLRDFRHGHVLRTAAADLAGALDAGATGRQLASIAEAVLEHSVAVVRNELVNRHGHPRCDGREPGFAIIAYGKLGSRELGYSSDLDLIYLYEGCEGDGQTDGERRPLANEEFFGRLARRTVHVLATRTATGQLYDVDMRLRPSGRAGPLVTSLDAYRAYQTGQAWTWEHQALVRARAVVGPHGMADAFESIRREVLTQRRDPDRLAADILEMRARMREAAENPPAGTFDLKQGAGGIVDIEFLVQYFVLRHACEHEALTIPRENTRLLHALAGLGLLEEEQAAHLADAYREYLSLEQHLKLMDRPYAIAQDELQDVRRRVTAIWREVFEVNGD